MQGHWSTVVKLLGKAARTQIILSPETPWTLYNYIHLEDNTAYVAKYWGYNETQNKNQKTSKTWNTVRYSVSNNQKPITITSRKCNNCICDSVVQLVAKYLRDIKSVKTEKFNFELDKFLELIPDEPKMPHSVTASGSNSILDQLTHLRAQWIYQSGGVPYSATEQS